MGDNTTLNPGVGGDVSASNDIGGVKHQRIKSEWGAAGTANETDDVDGKRFPVKQPMAATATRTSVADSATSVTLLAANANRKGATVFNDASGILFLALGAGPATSTDYTAQVVQGQGYEVPSCYTGVIVGIWDVDNGDGGARVTELS